MHKLGATHCQELFDQYKSTEFFFPLIGAVLLGQQDGNVYVDDLDCPRQAYVEHAFGFAQIFGQTITEFESNLERYLLFDRLFTVPKVRFYSTYLPDFLRSPEYDEIRSFRQRFSIAPKSFIERNSISTELKVVDISTQNVTEIEDVFGVVDRFWRGSDDFIRRSNVVLVHYRDQLAGICYAAAEADNRVEIDVLTLSEYRRLGIGKFAVREFVSRCFEKSLQPLWDCFANNAGSMGLCKAVGFSAVNEPYPFFTINKHCDSANEGV